MKLYIRENDLGNTRFRESSSQYTEKPYPYGSQEYKERMKDAVNEIRNMLKNGNADLIVLEPCIYVIFNNNFNFSIKKYLLDDWGNWGTVYGSLWEHTLDFLKQGGDPDDVTYTIKDGTTFTPYLKSGRLRYTVMYPDGSESDMNANQAEKAYWQSQIG